MMDINDILAIETMDVLEEQYAELQNEYTAALEEATKAFKRFDLAEAKEKKALIDACIEKQKAFLKRAQELSR
jgi:hypothetical protein